MALVNGTRLGPYEILSPVGAGGMGEVYKARDTRLDRIVAIKVSPEQFTERFEREAHAIAALNHPNVCQIYDVGPNYIVMEFIDGVTLDRLIAKNTLKLREILSIAAQVADGVAAAHAAGTLHRDLKPANVLVTSQGRAKVLDFGLAKIAEQVGADDATRTRALETEEGTVVGTVAYMSPEQAEGSKLDARSDIFSLGVILYEMLTGRRPFQGETRVSTMAAILRDEPKPITEPGGKILGEVERIVARCLRKDPARRFQTMADLKVALEEAKDESEVGRPAADLPRVRRVRYRIWAWGAAAAALFAVAGSSAFWWTHKEPPQQRNWAFRQLTFDSGLTTTPALSRDGKLLAYASDRATGANLDIYVQQLAGGRPLRLTEDDADDYNPQFSPDGTQVVFFSSRDGGGIYIVPSLGGEARLVARNGHFPRFSPDGKTIAYTSAGGISPNPLLNSYVYLVPAAGGKPRKLESGLAWSSRAIWSPDGTQLIMEGFSYTTRRAEWFLVPMEGGKAVSLGPLPANLRASATQWLDDNALLLGGNGLWKITIDEKRRRTGVPQPLTLGVGHEHSPSGDAQAKTIVFAAGPTTQNLWAIPIDGNFGKPKGELRSWTSGPSSNVYPTASADHRLLAYTSNRSGTWDVYVRQLEDGKEKVVPSSSGFVRAQISPDGSKLAVGSPSTQEISLLPIRGGVVEKLCSRDCISILGWTPDSRKILTWNSKPITDILVDSSDGKITTLLRHPEWDLHRPRFSPDGRWLAVNPKMGERWSAIFIVPFRNGSAAPPAEWIQITDGEGVDGQPEWSPDGNLLYFHSQRLGFNDQWAVRLDAATKRRQGEPFLVQSFHSARRNVISGFGCAVTKDWIIWSLRETAGNIFVMEQEPPAGAN